MKSLRVMGFLNGLYFIVPLIFRFGLKINIGQKTKASYSINFISNTNKCSKIQLLVAIL